MQTVSAAFTAEERDDVRKISQSLQVSWHRDKITSKTFTIGVSLIGGNDGIAANPGAIGSPGIYRYFNESSYVMSLAWERGLKIPLGGLTKALAEAKLDNTSARFTPRYMGGNSELYTAIQPRKPLIINAGFNVGASDYLIPAFAGILDKQPALDLRNKSIDLSAVDYTDYFSNKFLDRAVMFTAQRTDQVLTTLATQLGMNTAQYDFDYGVNVVPFGYFPAGTKFEDAISQLVEAENGQFYQDETGIFKFENRQHWSNAPYTQVQRIIYTAQVINAEAPNMDHIINVVEVNANIREKQPNQTIFTLGVPSILNANADTSIFVNFDDPILQIDNPTIWTANTNSDNSGKDISSQVLLKNIDKFAQAAKITFTNNGQSGFLTGLTITGRPAKVTNQLYTRRQDDSSVTAYQEQPLQINNDFIQNQSWAQSYAQMILNDFSDIENLQRITILAIPELQLGDLVSWQGRYWRVYNIKTTLDPSMGFVQELLMLQRNITTYFRIGISTIGGADKISA